MGIGAGFMALGLVGLPVEVEGWKRKSNGVVVHVGAGVGDAARLLVNNVSRIIIKTKRKT
jgi:hypothetical protein